MQNVNEAGSTVFGCKRGQSNCILAITEASLLHGMGITPIDATQKLDATLKSSGRVSSMIQCVEIKYVAADVLHGDALTISKLIQDPKGLLAFRLSCVRNNASKKGRADANTPDPVTATQSTQSAQLPNNGQASSKRRKFNFQSPADTQDATILMSGSSFSAPPNPHRYSHSGFSSAHSSGDSGNGEQVCYVGQKRSRENVADSSDPPPSFFATAPALCRIPSQCCLLACIS